MALTMVFVCCQCLQFPLRATGMHGGRMMLGSGKVPGATSEDKREVVLETGKSYPPSLLETVQLICRRVASSYLQSVL